MPRFGTLSMSRLLTCEERLQRLFLEVIKHVDCSVLCGHRGQAEQRQAYLDGTSKVDWPDGKHNAIPSRAVDVMPYPIDWKDKAGHAYFGGFVIATALAIGIRIRWGHDWDRDHDLDDQKFIDSPHYELTEPSPVFVGRSRPSKTAEDFRKAVYLPF